MACTSGGKSEWEAVPDQFPLGMRVLVVDDDVVCLRVLEKMLQRCMYNVTSCSQATVALNLLRERKGCFDVVLSDVHMPDMDGFKLLELVGLEMDLPVIMMSADGRMNLVMQGIRHGACDYLIKPIRDEELKNIWQHVVRKRCNEIKEHDHSGNMEDRDRKKRANDDVEYTSSANEGADEVLKVHKKRRDSKGEDDIEMENDDPTTAKKPRVVWSVELHQHFVSAVNQLGIDKAVPKRILELMNVPGVTRENVASHLQKFRLYLKRLSGVAQQQGGFPPYCRTIEQNLKLASLTRFDIQALAASGQLPPQALAALQPELLSRPPENLIFPAMDQEALLNASLHGSKGISKGIPVNPHVAYGQPLIKCSSNITKQASQSLLSDEVVNSEFAAWFSENPTCTLGTVLESDSDMLLNFIQKQQTVMPEPSRSINVQPSCLVVPSQSLPIFQPENINPVSVSPSCSFRNTAMDYSNPLPEYNNSSGVAQVFKAECKSQNTLSPVSSYSENVQGIDCKGIPISLSINGVLDFRSLDCMQDPYNGKCDLVQGSTTNHPYAGKNNGNKVKQEPCTDLSGRTFK
ncbi:hypothetical protein OROGR_010358 [Orobanche gracilis]